ncbi:MAG TPA: guanylate kinase [Anaerolineaceae bacterium]|jgi:guanylate kinase|nr:guanylate kinase [Anaerolineaceae bacterium]
MTLIDFELKKPERSPLLIVVSGPSGIGKDTVVQGLKDRKLPFHFVITATSRPPRRTEVDGRDYFFYSQEKFEEMIASGEFLEHAWVYTAYKGVPKWQVREALSTGEDVVMRLDFQGAKTVRELCPDAILIFLTANSKDEWLGRLRDRRSETEEELAVRIQTAKAEYESLGIFDYIVLNEADHLDRTLDVIESIIEAEHHRVNPRKVTL